MTACNNISRACWGDQELHVVRDHLFRAALEGERFSKVLRATIDQLLDGENAGRYDWNDLHKTEKTHAGTLVEINLQREFGFDDGHDMDYQIAGLEVDCKFSQKAYGWMIPPEALDEICLVVWADDQKSAWSAGLFRASREKLAEHEGKTRKGNRDGKYRLTRAHRSMVQWLWESEPLQENLLLHIDAATREAIYAQADNPPNVVAVRPVSPRSFRRYNSASSAAPSLGRWRSRRTT